jgi:hypothetical protein
VRLWSAGTMSSPRGRLAPVRRSHPRRVSGLRIQAWRPCEKKNVAERACWDIRPTIWAMGTEVGREDLPRWRASAGERRRTGRFCSSSGRVHRNSSREAGLTLGDAGGPRCADSPVVWPSRILLLTRPTCAIFERAGVEGRAGPQQRPHLKLQPAGCVGEVI